MIAPARKHKVRGAKVLWRAYLTLQIASSGILVLTFVLLQLAVSLVPGFPVGFGTSWLAAFFIAPVSFVPVLVWWNQWVRRNFGERKRSWRLLAELSLAVNVVGFVLYQGIA